MKDIIRGYIAEIGFDAVKDRIKDVKMEAATRERIENFLQQQQKLNFKCTIEEELDFEGLSAYIRNDLMTDVKLRLFGTLKERGQARRTIISKAAHYANTKTRISEKRAKQIVGTAVDILAKYYRRTVNRELLYVASEIEDTIIGELTTQNQKTLDRIDCAVEKVGSSALMSIDHNLALANAGHIEEVEKNFSAAIKAISSSHSLYPHYGYKLESQNTFISIPLTEAATKLYPPRFNITASSVQLGDNQVNRIDSNVLSQAYRHQLPIHIDVVAAKKYLGDVLDPIQYEAEEMVGARVVMTPPEFPKAFPCSITFDGNIGLDYLLLRTKEILDDGTVIITNEEQQNFDYHVKLALNPTTRRLNFSIFPVNRSNAAFLYCRQLLKQAALANKVAFKVLSLNTLLFEGTLDPFDLSTLDLEIAFLEKVVAIEKFFGTAFTIPEEITPNHHKTIDHLYSMIEFGKFSGKWENFTFTFIISDSFRQNIKEMPDVSCTLTYSGDTDVELFGQTLKVPVHRTINCARLVDLEKIKAKVSVLDDDDEIKLNYVPSEEDGIGKYTDTLYQEDFELEQDTIIL